MYSSRGSSGMLGLEMSLHHHIPQQTPQNPLHMQQQPHHSMVSYAHHEGDQQPQPQPPPPPPPQPQPQTHQMSAKQGYPFAPKPKNQTLALSDDDEPAGLAATENSADDGKRKMSPWQRMKWTDNMVRLLIMIVFYIGDEVGSEGNVVVDPSGKKKGGGGGGGGVLQKKGKWKSVSRAMLERGFYVSPQQCEDKFNDLNKRYKRVNDILGKGTACKVVEKQSLLESMDHLSPKMKEEVKKLLNSKHLFFREMCAYHNSCGHGVPSSSSGIAAPEGATEAAAASQGHHQQLQPTRCQQHSTENASIAANLGRSEVEGSRLGKGGNQEEDDDDDDEDDEDDDDDDDEDDNDEVVEGGGGGGGARGHGHEGDDDTNDERSSHYKRRKMGGILSPLIHQLHSELKSMFQDESKSALEKKQWMKTKLIQLEEQHVGYEYQAFELEKQRLKWLKFSSKKEREMERDKLSNERLKLENERMSLLIRQKELELLDQYQQNSRKSDPSSITG
ncbi:hypothetical protein M9H77_24189 [Catharanthus roseus]|uniref:Uncharacterized protein n=1 Tax=Catharanthus roseus TaxID=4058 RepID=A0ACC0AWD1_CATRO|nr:hypothetical protein M9H77_24189 [Catharanthus roseus]